MCKGSTDTEEGCSTSTRGAAPAQQPPHASPGSVPAPQCCHPRGRSPHHPPATIHLPQSCLGAVSSLVSQTHRHEDLGGVGGSEMPHPCAACGWQPVLGGTHPTVPSPAWEELASVAAALLDDHVLVVADDDFALLVVEHGEGAHPDGRAGRARHLVGLVELQQALRGHGKGTASAPCPVPPGWAAGARGNGGSGGSRTPLTCM